MSSLRIRALNSAAARSDGEFVLYWMTANRRLTWNFALDRAMELAREYRKPLVVLEALRCGYRWASDRIHHFVVTAMAEHRRQLAGSAVLYHPYVEARGGDGQGLLEALAERACAVVADDYPCFFLPRMIEAAAGRMAVRLEAVDSNGLLPMRTADREFTTAHSFRRFLQKSLPAHLGDAPRGRPAFDDLAPASPTLLADAAERWPAASSSVLDGDLTGLPLDHGPAPVEAAGGTEAAERRWRTFLSEKLPGYGQRRNAPEEDNASGLSPFLHFGFLSAHQVFAELAQAEGWTADTLGKQAGGKRLGWWGMSEGAETFLDQLVTWRELGFNMCSRREHDYDQYESLPEWARRTLAEHEADRRPHLYSREEFRNAATHDPLWNAAQIQLRTEGRIHNYLRMLWGKKVLEWSATPHEALSTLIELNNRYALDGRDPNSYSGIFWVFGRYDRAWGPERPVFGKVRYMTSRNTARKYRVDAYIERYSRLKV